MSNLTPARATQSDATARVRTRLCISGVVQGVGFRPFIYRLALELHLAGWVANNSAGVLAEIEGSLSAIDQFILRLEREKPPRSAIQSLEMCHLDPVGYRAFEIRPSDDTGAKAATVPPDIATCPECLSEIFAPGNRRYRYPFANCAHCGPRYSIIDSIPYDRAGTSMASFTMCPECRTEYNNPADRRFHAQPNACPACGPRLELWDRAGSIVADGDQALKLAAAGIADEKILAVKGIGGFHLMVLAASQNAVLRLRNRKHREEKPFAIMAPSSEAASHYCEMGMMEERLLRSPQAPIVLLKRKPGARREVCDAAAPGNPCLGVMIPYTPLHHLLLGDLGVPVVATSGNLTNEPICFDERQALGRLGSIADFFLVHNRPIRRPVDDSIVQVVLGREMVLRRARGFAPLPVVLSKPIRRVFAAGAHLKSCIAVSDGTRVHLSQHLGDLETEVAGAAYQEASRDLLKLNNLHLSAPEGVAACDLHPNYLSTRFARACGLPLIQVQHHYAHALACMADNELDPPCLAVCWDGTGLGADGTAWGGEFLRINKNGFERLLHLRPFRLPGGDAAARQPRRAALGVLFEIFGEAALAMPHLPAVESFNPEERGLLAAVLARGLNAPLTTSAGRLFDAVASLLGIAQQISFEGQAAMALEFLAESSDEAGRYDFAVSPDKSGGCIVDWEPAIRAILADLAAGIAAATIAARFHNTLAEMVVAAAHLAGESKVALSGGCFQNRRLTEATVGRLRAVGFKPYWHQRIPPNDGGIAVGQVLAAVRELRERAADCDGN